MGEAMDTAAIGGCTPQAAICTRGVTRDFVAGQQTITVLHGIDLDIRAGELTFLVGESGSGKTTLISIMCGILWPTLGEVKVFGTDIYDLADTELVEFRLQNIGFIFQQYNLIPSIDAASNAAVPLIAQGMDRHDARERAVAMLEKLNIGDQAAKLPNQLSGGQQPEGDRQGFLVGKHHRRQLETGHQPVSTIAPLLGHHGNAQLFEHCDVASDGSPIHAQPLRQFGTANLAVGLQQFQHG